MLSKLQGQSEDRLLVQVLHAANFLRPNVLKLELNSLYRQKEAVKRVVFLVDVRTEHEVDRPLTLVDEREAAPGVLLIGLDTTLEDPVFDQEHVRQV